MYYDSHTHLNCPDLFADWENLAIAFADAGGEWLVNAGADETYNTNGISIAKQVSANPAKFGDLRVACSVGLHPYETLKGDKSAVTTQNMNDKIKDLTRLIVENRDFVSVVGECGTDLHYPNASGFISLQQELFRRQCELASKFWLPIMIHSRDSRTQTRDIISQYPSLSVYFHCRNYSPAEIQQTLDFGFRKIFFGFCGNVTYKNAQNIRDSLKLVHLQNMFIETDAPYLAPQVVRWQMNKPDFIRYIYDFVSEYLSIDQITLQKNLKNNFFDFYFTKNT